MADDATIVGAAGVTYPVAADDIGSGRLAQLVKPVYGSDGAATMVDVGTGLPIQSGWKEVTGSAAANNTDLVSTDVSGYRWVSVQLSGTFSATVSWQCSNDNTNWANCFLRQPGDATTSPLNFGNTPGVYSGAVNARYFRARVTSYTSGTVTSTAEFTVLPSLPSAVVSYVSNTPAVSQSGTWTVQPVPGTSGGWTPYVNGALSNTAQSVKSSAGQVGGYIVNNPNTVTCYVQVYNTASGSVAVGTTVATWNIPVPPTSTANLSIDGGVAHGTAISVAATTTATGSTAPGTPLDVSIFYK